MDAGPFADSPTAVFSGDLQRPSEILFHWLAGLGATKELRWLNSFPLWITQDMFWERCSAMLTAVTGYNFTPSSLRRFWQSTHHHGKYSVGNNKQKRHCAAAAGVNAFSGSPSANFLRDLLVAKEGITVPPELASLVMDTLSALAMYHDRFEHLPISSRLAAIQSAVVAPSGATWRSERDSDGRSLSFRWSSGLHNLNRTRLVVKLHDLAVQLFVYGQLIPLPCDSPVSGCVSCKEDLLTLIEFIGDMQPCYGAASQQDLAVLGGAPDHIHRIIYVHASRSSALERSPGLQLQPDDSFEGCLPEARLAHSDCSGLISSKRTFLRCPACHHDAARLCARASNRHHAARYYDSAQLARLEATDERVRKLESLAAVAEQQQQQIEHLEQQQQDEIPQPAVKRQKAASRGADDTLPILSEGAQQDSRSKRGGRGGRGARF